MLDFLQGARGQDFHDITLMVDGEAIGAHKVREYLLIRLNRLPKFLASTLSYKEIRPKTHLHFGNVMTVMEQLCLFVKARFNNGVSTKKI